MSIDLNYDEDKLFIASHWQLIIKRFKKHKLGYISLIFLLIFYFIAFTYEFWAPYDKNKQHKGFVNSPPSKIYLFDEKNDFIGPFVYKTNLKLNLNTFKREYIEDKNTFYKISFFTKGDKYYFWGIFETNIHFFNVDEGKIFLLGTDQLGQDMFSRILAGSRISLTIGLVGVLITFLLGTLLGGYSGFYGGIVDVIIMRLTEILGAIPKIPLWIALAAIVPMDWPVILTYFTITIIISTMEWTYLARAIRAKLLELREHDYILAAKFMGSSDLRIIYDHLLPGYASFLIVNLTLSIPNMILAETSLSFLGLGIRPPAVSWGTLLEGAQNISNIALRPWMLLPAILVIITVLLFNFVGDGLRDAADPYKEIS